MTNFHASCTENKSAIEGYLSQCFRLNGVTQKTESTTLENAIVREIIGRGQCRYGAVVNQDSCKVMTSVVAKCIKENRPIPILCPWGSRKPHHTGVDVADLGGIRMIECLSQRVREHYRPGISVRVRIENIGGHYLFADTGEAGRQASTLYVQGLLELIRALGLEYLTPVPESTLMTEADHVALAQKFLEVILNYIIETDNEGIEQRGKMNCWHKLQSIGWQGEIPTTQREYYRKLYRKLYPGSTEEAHTCRLATYLASSLARYKLKASGAAEEWEKDFLNLNFCPPIPGMPHEMCCKTVHYRTIPESLTSTHIPPWRAKGYLKIPSSGQPCLKIASWTETFLLQPCTVRVERDGFHAIVDTPIMNA